MKNFPKVPGIMFAILIQLFFQIFPELRRTKNPYRRLPNEGIHKAATPAILVVGKLAFLVALNEFKKVVVAETEPNRVLPFLEVGKVLLELNNGNELESQTGVQVGRKLYRVAHVFQTSQSMILQPWNKIHLKVRMAKNPISNDVAKVKDWKDVVGNERTKTGERWPLGV